MQGRAADCSHACCTPQIAERKPEEDFEWDLAALLYRNQDDKFFVETELHLDEYEQVRAAGWTRP